MAPDFSPVNFAEAGWKTRQGQAIWRPNRGASEMVGELLVARHATGRVFVQFTKSPFPLVTAQSQPAPVTWQVEFPPRNISLSGSGRAPPRWLWLHLPDCLLENATPPKPWALTRTAPEARWYFENARSGETLEVFLNP